MHIGFNVGLMRRHVFTGLNLSHTAIGIHPTILRLPDP